MGHGRVCTRAPGPPMVGSVREAIVGFGFDRLFSRLDYRRAA
jgi:hypothetical protein